MVEPSEDPSGTPVAGLQHNYFSHFIQNYSGRLMVNLGFTQEIGNAILKESNADLVSFGAPFIANPDLAERFRYHILLPESNPDTIYAGGKMDMPTTLKRNTAVILSSRK